MATEWFYFKGDQRFGPVGSKQLKDLATTGDLQPTDLVWRDGMADPLPAAKLKGLFAEVPSPLPLPDDTPSRPVATPEPLPQVAADADRNKDMTIELPTTLESKWVAIYGQQKGKLTFSDVLLFEAFHKLVPNGKKLFKYPDVPDKKLRNAKGYANLIADEIIIALIDDTLFGSANDGCLITNCGIHWHNTSEKPGYRMYSELVPEEVKYTGAVVSMWIELNPSTRITCTSSDKATISAVASFIQHAAALSVAMSGKKDAPAYVPSQLLIRKALETNLFDAALTDAVRKSGIMDASVVLDPNTILPIEEPLLSRSFNRTKEDLEMLQSEINQWFTDKGYITTTIHEGAVRAVISVKEGLMRSVMGNRQKFLVRIQQRETDYTLEMAYGELEEKSSGGKVATAVVNFYSLGIPAISGEMEAESVKNAFSEWLEIRSSKVCPKCEKNDAKSEPKEKIVGTNSAAENHNGAMHQVTSTTWIVEVSCQYCGHSWSEGQEKTVKASCTQCKVVKDNSSIITDAKETAEAEASSFDVAIEDVLVDSAAIHGKKVRIRGTYDALFLDVERFRVTEGHLYIDVSYSQLPKDQKRLILRKTEVEGQVLVIEGTIMESPGSPTIIARNIQSLANFTTQQTSQMETLDSQLPSLPPPQSGYPAGYTPNPIVEAMVASGRNEQPASQTSATATAARCPKCGFSFGWNGNACTHCKFNLIETPSNPTGNETPSHFEHEQKDHLQFICPHCLSGFHGNRKVGEQTRCSNCGKVFNIVPFAGMQDSLWNHLNVVGGIVSIFAGEKCPMCKQRNVRILGKKLVNQAYTNRQGYSEIHACYYQCDSCVHTYYLGETFSES